MKEIIFVVEEAPEGGYATKALDASIFTEADDLAELEINIRDAVVCHFEEPKQRCRTTTSAGSNGRNAPTPANDGWGRCCKFSQPAADT